MEHAEWTQYDGAWQGTISKAYQQNRLELSQYFPKDFCETYSNSQSAFKRQDSFLSTNTHRSRFN